MTATATPNIETPKFATLRAQFDALPAANRLSDDQLEAIYGLAYALYHQGQYEDAERSFHLLTLYRPLNPRFLKGMALCQFMARHFPEAVATCSFILAMDPLDVETLYVCAQSLLLGGDLVGAKELFGFTVRLSEKNPDIAKRAQAVLDIINQ